MIIAVSSKLVYISITSRILMVWDHIDPDDSVLKEKKTEFSL